MKRRRKRKRRAKGRDRSPALPSMSWWADDGLHMVAPGLPPSSEELEEMTKVFQEKLRRSPLWDELVRRYGEEKAEEAIEGCRVALR